MQESKDDQLSQELVVGPMETINAGSIDFGLDYRRFGEDEGVAIHVYADLHGRQTELLRFDCLNDAPHYHYGPDGKDERLMFDYTAEGDPIPWAIVRLRDHIVPMLIRAGFSDVARNLDYDLVQDRLNQVEAWASSLARTKGR